MKWWMITIIIFGGLVALHIVVKVIANAVITEIKKQEDKDGTGIISGSCKRPRTGADRSTSAPDGHKR